ncbi:hypothetical protein [Streptomyces sp. NPDC012756]|uniref:hypothetical protein n=1 Tax=unclassified Streptomyces TaxID=2593676 RepID=UPI0036D0FCB0
MSHHDPGAAGPRRARRRHASARRGRGAVWLLAGGGVTVLGLAGALLAGGLGKSGGTRSPADDGADGPPALIQSDPSADPSGTSGSPGGGATSVPGRTGTTAPAVKTTATTTPSGAATTAPDATSPAAPTATTPDDTRPVKPGKGRGSGRRPR